MITTELVADRGRTLLIKRVDPGDDGGTARLAHEATMLAIARHPGVVEVADAHPAVGLSTVYAGSRTLATIDLDPTAALQALAVVAQTVADLHALGLVHGRLDADHVVLSSGGRAVLCGFAEAGLAGDRRPDGGWLRPSVDIAALGSLLTRFLDRMAATTPIGPPRSGIDRPGLARFAARATADDVRLRPSARAFGATLTDALPRSSRAGLVVALATPAAPPPSDLA